MRVRRSLAAALIGLALAAPAVAAAPPGVPNDEPAGAIAITAVPFTGTQSTSKATANVADGGCGAGGEDQATVWYSMTLTAATRVLIDTTASSYVTGINVFSDGGLVTCQVTTAVFDADAGQTYSVMIADIDGGRNGGRLSVSVGVGAPALELGVTIDPNVSLDAATGALTVSGTVTCNVPADFVDVNLEASQTTGRFTVRGFAFTSVGCAPGDPVPWSADVSGEEPFGTGATTITAAAFGCDPFSCDETVATVSLRIRR